MIITEKTIITNTESTNRVRVYARVRVRAGKAKVVIAFVTQTAWQLKMIAALALITAKEAKDSEVAIE